MQLTFLLCFTPSGRSRQLSCPILRILHNKSSFHNAHTNSVLLAHSTLCFSHQQFIIFDTPLAYVKGQDNTLGIG